METLLRKAFAVALFSGAALAVTPAFAQAGGQNANRANETADQKAQAAQNDAATTLNNTPAVPGSPSANMTGRSATGGASAPASSTTRHAMGVGNSGGNNTPAATTDAQSQATRELNQQPPGSASGNMK